MPYGIWRARKRASTAVAVKTSWGRPCSRADAMAPRKTSLSSTPPSMDRVRTHGICIIDLVADGIRPLDRYPERLRFALGAKAHRPAACGIDRPKSHLPLSVPNDIAEIRGLLPSKLKA